MGKKKRMSEGLATLREWNREFEYVLHFGMPYLFHFFQEISFRSFKCRFFDIVYLNLFNKDFRVEKIEKTETAFSVFSLGFVVF